MECKKDNLLMSHEDGHTADCPFMVKCCLFVYLPTETRSITNTSVLKGLILSPASRSPYAIS